MKQSQKAMILAYLKTGRAITPLDALQHFGCMRLSERIRELNKDGYQIVTIPVHDKAKGKRYASYRLTGAL